MLAISISASQLVSLLQISPSIDFDTNGYVADGYVIATNSAFRDYDKSIGFCIALSPTISHEPPDVCYISIPSSQYRTYEHYNYENMLPTVASDKLKSGY
jgi:hypothetical protein